MMPLLLLSWLLEADVPYQQTTMTPNKPVTQLKTKATIPRVVNLRMAVNPRRSVRERWKNKQEKNELTQQEEARVARSVRLGLAGFWCCQQHCP